MNHSPAPWTFGEDGWITDGDGRPILQAVDGEHQIGNGNLGAAAPALLAVCEKVVDFICKSYYPSSRPAFYVELIAAIKLAEPDPEPQPQVLPPRSSGRIDFFGLTAEEQGQ